MRARAPHPLVDASPLREAFRLATKSLLYRGFSHRSAKQHTPIAVFGSRRSGTTHLMEIISANRGIRYVDQPLTVHRLPTALLSHLPLYQLGQYVDVKPQDLDAIVQFLHAILEGHIRVHEPWRLWRTDFPFRYNRSLLKLTDAPYLARELTDRLKMQLVILVRHPLAQATSVARARWGHIYPPYLRSTQLAAMITRDALDLAHQIDRTGSNLERHVLDWCVENVYFARFVSSWPDALLLKFEDLVGSPCSAIGDLSRHLDLHDRPRMRRVVHRPSMSVRKISASNSESYIRSQRSRLTDAWRDQIEAGEMASLLKIVSAFSIDWYNSQE